MNRRILCGLLAALMMWSAAACTDFQPPADTSTDTTASTQTTDTTEAPTEADTEADTAAPFPEIQAPAYEDIGITSLLRGEDTRITSEYPYQDMGKTLTQLKSDKYQN